MIKFRPVAKFDKSVNIVFFHTGDLSSKKSNCIENQSLLSACQVVYKNKLFQGEAGEIFPLTQEDKIVLMVGLGEKKGFSLTALRIAVRRALLSPCIKEAKEIEVIPFSLEDDIVRAIIEGISIGLYSWDKYRTQPAKKTSSKTYYIAVPKKQVFLDTVAVSEGVTLTRDLINDNADFITSEYLEKVVKGLVKGNKNISLEVLGKKELKAKGLNLHLAVNQGSLKPPKLIIVKYKGASAKDKYTSIIGKGMTYDSGGLNLKPTGSIETMRCDMSGAAAVIGVLKNTITLKLKKNILFVLGVAENAISAGAYKPGDIVKSYSGKTVEVGNTDAEGRLVLADAISYVVKNYKPHRIIDVATLTGACVIALGYDYTGLISNDNSFAADLLEVANETDDRAWRLPSYPEIKDYVKSNSADIRNLGLPRGAAGTLTAAEFLRQFTEDTLWAHLDIAGTAFNETKERFYYGYGATGAGVRLLTAYLGRVVN